MASVFKKRKGYIAQIVVDGRRIPASLGQINRADASFARQMLTQLERSRDAGTAPSVSVAAWLESIGPKMHGAVVKLGLAEPRAVATGAVPMTVAKMFADYLAGRPELSFRGRNNIEQAGNSLSEFTGAEKMVARFRTADAVAWKRWLSPKYSGSTISSFVKKSRQVFKWAVKCGAITENPMEGIVAGQQVNEARSRYVDADTVFRVIAVTNDPQWRLLIATSRFAGLRVPSEAHLLKWSDVEWDATPPTLTVHSPKTRNQGKPSRRVPINADLMPLLKSAFDARDPMAPRVFTILAAGYNPHTQFKRLVERAGASAWPRLWHNLRASCQTDLEEFLPQHVACRFMGNSPSTARKHYLQVTGVHLVKAAAQTAARDANSHEQSRQIEMKTLAKNAENRVPAIGNAVLEVPPRGMSEQRRTRWKLRSSPRRAARTAAHVRQHVEESHRFGIGAKYFAELAAIVALADRRAS